MATPANLRDDALALPVDDRADLALALLRSLDDAPDPDALAQWDAEVDRRAADVAAGTAPTMTLAEYRAHVAARRSSAR